MKLSSVLLAAVFSSAVVAPSFASEIFVKDQNQIKMNEVITPDTPSPAFTADPSITPEPNYSPTPEPTYTPEEIPTATPTSAPTLLPTPKASPKIKLIKPEATPKPKVTPTPKPKPVVKAPVDYGKLIYIKNDKNTDKYILKPGKVTFTEYTVQKGDTLRTIAKKFAMRYRTLVALNNAKTPYLIIGQKIILDKSVQPVSTVDGIVVNIPENKLYYFENGQFKKSYPVSVGLPDPKWQTPLGNYKISEKVKAPVWHIPVSIQKEMAAKGMVVKKEVPAGPGNPLGNWWMGLSHTGVGIHSTNAPLSVGYSVSHGCIRMRPANAAELFQKVRKNMPVRIIYQPVKLSIDSNKVYAEVHRDVYGKVINTTEATKKMIKDFGLDKYVDWKKLTPIIRAKSGNSFNISKDSI